RPPTWRCRADPATPLRNSLAPTARGGQPEPRPHRPSAGTAPERRWPHDDQRRSSHGEQPSCGRRARHPAGGGAHGAGGVPPARRGLTPRATPPSGGRRPPTTATAAGALPRPRPLPGAPTRRAGPTGGGEPAPPARRPRPSTTRAPAPAGGRPRRTPMLHNDLTTRILVESHQHDLRHRIKVPPKRPPDTRRRWARP